MFDAEPHLIAGDRALAGAQHRVQDTVADGVKGEARVNVGSLFDLHSQFFDSREGDSRSEPAVSDMSREACAASHGASEATVSRERGPKRRGA